MKTFDKLGLNDKLVKGLAMGVATVVLSIMKTIDTNTAITLLGIGVTSIGISQLSSEN